MSLRLPTAVRPLAYKLELDIDVDGERFSGTVTATAECTESTKVIWMSAHPNLTVTSATVNGTVVSVESHGPQRQIALQCPEEIAEGAAVETVVQFKAPLRRDLAGLYLTTEGDLRAAVTQMEPNDACRLVPHWDEPAFKAVWEVTVHAAAGLTVLHNTDAVERLESDGGKRQTVRFEPTPKMSSYLLALSVGPFDRVQSKTKRGLPVDTYAFKGNDMAAAQRAGDLQAAAIDFYEEFFGVEYAMKQCKALAVPDFSAGAMENWGLIIYRTRCLMLGDALTPSERLRVVSIIAHEVAHQWFGNLVSPQWWSDLWLNEGFAQFSMVLCASRIDPFGAKAMHFPYATRAYEAALLRDDAMPSTHPVRIEFASADDVSGGFDSISYYKGFGMVKMVYFWLGEAKFRAALKAYFQKFSHGNAWSSDLWDALDAEAGDSLGEGVTVRSVMDQWINVHGFPQLRVELVGETDDHVELEVRQARFKSGGPKAADPAGSDPNQRWAVPFVVRRRGDVGDTPDCVWRAPSPMPATAEPWRVKVPVKAKGDWVLLNAFGTAPLVVSYSPELLRRLVAAVEAGELTHASELTLLSAYITASLKVGEVSMADGMESLATLLRSQIKTGADGKVEALSDPALVVAFIDALVALCPLHFAPTDDKAAGYRRWLRDLLWPLWEALGARSDAERDGKLYSSADAVNDVRSAVMSQLVMSARDDTVIDELAGMLAACKDGDVLELPSTAQRPAVKAALMRDSAPDSALVDRVIGWAQNDSTADDAQRSRVALASLWAVATDAQWKHVLEEMPRVRASERPSCLYAVAYAGGERGRQTWAYLRDNFDAFLEDVPPLFAMSNVMNSGVADFVVQPELVDEVVDFFAKRPEVITAYREKMAAKLRTRVLQHELIGKDLDEWLASL